jgi:hypothetical protein
VTSLDARSLMRVLRVAFLCIAAVVVLAGCGTAHREDDTSTHRPGSDKERRAAAVFSEYSLVAAAGDAVQACRLLIKRAARQHHCSSAPKVPKALRRASTDVGTIIVRTPQGYDTDMHLSARIPARLGGNLVAFLDYRQGEWLITRLVRGAYG